MNPFNLPVVEPLLVVSPDAQKYKRDETVTVSKMTFYVRLSEQVGHLFDPPFKWDHVFMAGGFLSGLMETQYDPELYQESDIDLFVYGSNLRDLQARMRQVISHLQKSTSNIYFIVAGCHGNMVIDCLIAGWTRRLQLIGLCPTKRIPDD